MLVAFSLNPKDPCWQTSRSRENSKKGKGAAAGLDY